MFSKKLDQVLSEKLAILPPASNNADQSKSEIVQQIATTLGIPTNLAVMVFERYRSWNRNVLVFDRISRKWHGRDWRGSDETVESALRREVAVLVAEVRRLRQEMNSIHKGFKNPYPQRKKSSTYR
jgi:hypothetical protein